MNWQLRCPRCGQWLRLDRVMEFLTLGIYQLDWICEVCELREDLEEEGAVLADS